MAGFESDFAVPTGTVVGGVNPAAIEFAMMGNSPKVQTCPFGCDSKLSELKQNYDHLEKLYNDSFIQVQAYKNTLKTLEHQKDWYHITQLALEEKVRILSANLENTTNTLKYSKALYDQAKLEKKEWEVKFVESLARTKLGLRFKEYIGSDEVCDLSTPSVFDPEPDNKEVKSLYESPKTNDSFSTVDVKLLPKSDVKDPSLTNDLPSCSFKKNVKPPRNLCNKSGTADRIPYKNTFVRTKKCFVCGSKSHLIKDCNVHDTVDNFPFVVSKATSVPAGSRNSSASISAGQSIHASSRNRSASIHAGRSIPAASRNKPASIHVGKHIPAGRINKPTPFLLVVLGEITDLICSGVPRTMVDLINLHGFALNDPQGRLKRHDLYTFNLSDIQLEQHINCLLAKASLEESTKWHRRMAHVNFKTINKLAKHGLVEGLPPKLFTNEHNCVACNKGKQHKASYKAISTVRIISEPLQLLHMDLFGPTSIRSIDHKYYSLVVTDDFKNQLNKKVKAIRCDNGTEFQNAKLIALCGEKGIKRDYRNARTPQQNGVAEQKNRTLIEAARSMLADSKLPTMFWTETVSTACYVLNRVSITNPHNKTPYELLSGKVPPPITGTFMPTSYQSNLAETQATFGSNSNTSSITTSESNDFVSCDNSDKSPASETYDFASCVSSPKTNDSFSTVDVKILPKSDVKDLSLTNGLPSCSFKENVKPHRNLSSVPAGSRNSSASTSAGRSIPAASRNRSSSIHAGRSIPAASRNRSASIHAGRYIPAASRNRPASIHAGKHIPA
nr:putative ribonuclease H-like domain-containing protein [Tanacetum cinerariifolium]